MLTYAALIMLQVRNGPGGYYEGSSVEAFVSDLLARGLLVESVTLPDYTGCGEEDSPLLLRDERLRLYRITAPADAGARMRVNFQSPPGAFGRMTCSYLGDDVDAEILGQWQQSVEDEA
jgi:hypothetical protein